MENPLERSISEDPIKKIKDLACDMAYGAAHKMWASHFMVDRADNEAIIADDGLNNGLAPKWKSFHNYYAIPLLVSFGYLERSSSRDHLNTGQAYFDLTPKAFALLEEPITSPKVFISYKQTESSALGLLIEARLKLADDNMTVFIDKLLEGGSAWELTLEERVREADNFICLITPQTLVQKSNKRNMILQEIEWAFDTLNPERRIIPIWHNGYKLDGNYPLELKDIQAIPVETESAKGYESAISDLLNILGYSNI